MSRRLTPRLAAIALIAGLLSGHAPSIALAEDVAGAEVVVHVSITPLDHGRALPPSRAVLPATGLTSLAPAVLGTLAIAAGAVALARGSGRREETASGSRRRNAGACDELGGD